MRNVSPSGTRAWHAALVRSYAGSLDGGDANSRPAGDGAMELLIGDKLWSTWSMRPWLALKHTGAPFTETLIRLRREETNADARAAGSPNGRVPVLKDDAVTVWDSIAICEYLAEKFPAARLWPADAAARALGRSAAAEMHSSFASLRGECPMDLGLKDEVTVSEA